MNQELTPIILIHLGAALVVAGAFTLLPQRLPGHALRTSVASLSSPLSQFTGLI
jgi:hypothetical protein